MMTIVQLKIPEWVSEPSSQPVYQSPTASWHSWPPRPQRTRSVCDGRVPPPAGPVDWWWVLAAPQHHRYIYWFVFVELWMLMLEELRVNVTNDIIVVEAELAGLAGFENLHSDELDLGFAVLKHLLCCCKQFSVLQGQHKIKSCKNKYRFYVVMGNSLYAKLSFDYPFKSVFYLTLFN